MQIGVLILSICHIVLIIDDTYPDLNFWKYLNTIDMLRIGIPDVSSAISLSNAPSTTSSASFSAFSSVTHLEYSPEIGKNTLNYKFSCCSIYIK